MAMRQLVQHDFDRTIVIGQRLANARGQSTVLDEFTQRFAGQREVRSTAIVWRVDVVIGRRRGSR